MVVFPNAKINIGLNVTAKRPDGYHEIETIMMPVKWCDSLEVVPSSHKKSTLTVFGRKVDCPTESNLVMRAYRAMQERYDLPPVEMFLYKNIPDGAGLGGGSSDASFTIKTLASLFNLNVNDNELASVAATIGADCPFFIYNRPMLATGIGTTLTAVDVNLSANHIVIIKLPDTCVSTKEAYGGIKPKPIRHNLVETISGSTVDGWAHLVKNDFEPVVFNLHPEIGELKHRLMACGAEYAAMSGSGAAVYGLFATDKLSEQAARQFKGCEIFVGTI